MTKKNAFPSLWCFWCQFWFEANYYLPMKWFRVAFSFLMFAFYLIRTLDFSFFFSENGILGQSAVSKIYDMTYRLSVFDLTPYTGSVPVVFLLNLIFLLSLLTLALGFFPRTSALVAFVLHVSFLHRNMAIIYGVDRIATFFLFYFCLADFRPNTLESRTRFKNRLGSAIFRLCQIQICIIYGFSGLEKLKGYYWWQGEAVWDVLANPQIARFDFSWMTPFPLVLIFLAYLTVLWEIYFPVLIWLKKTRNAILGIGVVFHLAIAIAINLPFFGAIMIITYILFIDPEKIARISFTARKKIQDLAPTAEESIV